MCKIQKDGLASFVRTDSTSTASAAWQLFIRLFDICSRSVSFPMGEAARVLGSNTFMMCVVFFQTTIPLTIRCTNVVTLT